MKTTLIEIFGWMGTAAVLGAYALVSFGLLKSSGFLFQFLNLGGAVALGLICFRKKVYQGLVINAVWGLIAVLAILNLLRT